MSEVRYYGDERMVTLLKGNIEEQRVDFIVNAANEELLWEDKTVNGAIHLGGGQELTDTCAEWVKNWGKVEVSEFAITPGYNLPCKSVIHTVGPVYPCNRNAASELERTYRNVLSWADHQDVLNAYGFTENEGRISIAIPAISTGVFSYPFREATEIQLRVAHSFRRSLDIRLVYYTDEQLEIAEAIYDQ